jgi:23S rRNA (adenine2503-C2)-methyltransferase
MTDISKKMAAELENDFYISALKPLKREQSSDGTIKYLFELTDQSVLTGSPELNSKNYSSATYGEKSSNGATVETVIMRYIHGNSVCVSTQAGCDMGCVFCASALGGKIRDLTAGEILDQVIYAEKDAHISNIVLMGIGEPLDNYRNVIKFLKNVNDANGLNIGYRHISLSTCGLVPQIYDLAEENIPLTLSVSLHAPNDEIRTKIMPVAKKYSYDILLNSIKNYIKKTKRRVSFEYTLIDGVNDSDINAKELSAKLKGILCHINLIPVNKARGRLEPSQKVEKFKNILIKNGLNATVRRTLGADINAACGQLRAIHN